MLGQRARPTGTQVPSGSGGSSAAHAGFVVGAQDPSGSGCHPLGQVQGANHAGPVGVLSHAQNAAAGSLRSTAVSHAPATARPGLRHASTRGAQPPSRSGSHPRGQQSVELSEPAHARRGGDIAGSGADEGSDAHDTSARSVIPARNHRARPPSRIARRDLSQNSRFSNFGRVRETLAASTRSVVLSTATLPRTAAAGREFFTRVSLAHRNAWGVGASGALDTGSAPAATLQRTRRRSVAARWLPSRARRHHRGSGSARSPPTSAGSRPTARVGVGDEGRYDPGHRCG